MHYTLRRRGLSKPAWPPGGLAAGAGVIKGSFSFMSNWAGGAATFLPGREFRKRLPRAAARGQAAREPQARIKSLVEHLEECEIVRVFRKQHPSAVAAIEDVIDQARIDATEGTWHVANRIWSAFCRSISRMTPLCRPSVSPPGLNTARDRPRGNLGRWRRCFPSRRRNFPKDRKSTRL